MGAAGRMARRHMATTRMTAAREMAAPSSAAAAMPYRKGRTGQRDDAGEHCRRPTQAPTFDSHDSLSFTALKTMAQAALQLKLSPLT
jgi:hypothetical protein